MMPCDCLLMPRISYMSFNLVTDFYGLFIVFLSFFTLFIYCPYVVIGM